MGIYLGQLPPAEIARLKAELAETLTANFCYPRFFDHRTESLHTRPVDRAKRQEVWLYLSSVDFTAWNRVDLMSPELQNQIERLFIQFMQRNRSFFGEQGRRRMSDVRMLIGTCAASVSQRLRNHLSGQKQTNPPFGSPRPVVSWTTTTISGRAEPGWEQIAATTMVLQQQIQEARGEVKASSAASDGRLAVPGASVAATPVATNGVGRRSLRSQPTTTGANNGGRVNETGTQQPTAPQPHIGSRPLPAVAKGTPVTSAPAASVAPPVSSRLSGPLAETPIVARKPEPLSRSEPRVAAVSPVQVPTRPAGNGRTSPQSGPLPGTSSSLSRNLAQATQSSQTAQSVAPTTGPREMMSVGEDDVAIFEQMRHQLVLWLRLEAIKADIEISGQGPAQLLDLLRQQAHIDETRLQVISTLLNLSNQVIKTGLVTVLDYKQALMFHLMHTRN